MFKLNPFLVLATTTIQGFPWPLIPGLIGFFLAFVVQFQLKNHVDRNKVLDIQNMADLYPNGIPPRKVLTERGQRLHLWFYGGGRFVHGEHPPLHDYLFRITDRSNQTTKPRAKRITSE